MRYTIDLGIFYLLNRQFFKHLGISRYGKNVPRSRLMLTKIRRLLFVKSTNPVLVVYMRKNKMTKK